MYLGTDHQSSVKESISIPGSVYHIVNLVGWREILALMDDLHASPLGSRNHFLCDSWSLSIMSRIFGKRSKRLPGPQIWCTVRKNKSLDIVWPSNAKASRISAPPTFSSVKDPRIHEYASNFESTADNIVIGIGSPQQNYLASKILDCGKIEEVSNIWCLGAALSLDQPGNGMYLARLLVNSPRRTLKKLSITACEILKIFMFERKEFKRFISFLSDANLARKALLGTKND